MDIKSLNNLPIIYWYGKEECNNISIHKSINGVDFLVYLGDKCIFRTALANDNNRGLRASLSVFTENVREDMVKYIVLPKTFDINKVFKHTDLTAHELWMQGDE